MGTCKELPSNEIQISYLSAGNLISSLTLNQIENLEPTQSLQLYELSLYTKIDTIKINCLLSSAHFVNQNSKPLIFKNLVESSEIDISELKSSPTNFIFWFAGSLLFLTLMTALTIFIYKVSESLSRVALVYLFLSGIMLFYYHLSVSPGVLNQANPLTVLETVKSLTLRGYEGLLYHLFITALAVFVPHVQILSFLMTLFIFAILAGCFLLLDRSRTTHFFFVFICLMPWISPASVGFTQFIERGVICSWLTVGVLILFLLYQRNSVLKRNQMASCLILLGLLQLLSLLRYELLIISVVLSFFIFSKLAHRLIVVVFISLVTLSVGTLLENKLGDDPKWRDEYLVVSAFNYVQSLQLNNRSTPELDDFLNNYYDLEKIKQYNLLWAALKQKRSTDYNFEKLALHLLKPIQNNFDVIIKGRFHLFGYSLRRGWTTTEPTEQNIGQDRYSLFKTYGFFQNQEVHKSEIYQSITKERYFLRYSILLLIFPLLCFKRTPALAIVVMALTCKYLFTFWLIPSAHLAYVFDMFIFAFPLFLLFLKDFYAERHYFFEAKSKPSDVGTIAE